MTNVQHMNDLRPVNISKLTNDNWLERCKLLTKMADTSRALYRLKLASIIKHGVNISELAMMKPEKAWDIVMAFPGCNSDCTGVSYLRSILVVGYIERITRAAYEKHYDAWREFVNGKQMNANIDNYKSIMMDPEKNFTLDEIKKKILAAPHEQHFERMLLGLYTLIPPCRLDYKMAQIHATDPGKNPAEGNHIIIGGDRPRVVLNTYKTSKLYGQIENDIPIELLEIIVQSLRETPRDMLFVSSIAVKRASMAILGVNLGVNDYRRIFASSINAASLTNDEHAEFARKMGHSAMTSFQKYRQVNLGKK